MHRKTAEKEFNALARSSSSDVMTMMESNNVDVNDVDDNVKFMKRTKSARLSSSKRSRTLSLAGFKPRRRPTTARASVAVRSGSHLTQMRRDVEALEAAAAGRGDGLYGQLGNGDPVDMLLNATANVDGAQLRAVVKTEYDDRGMLQIGTDAAGRQFLLAGTMRSMVEWLMHRAAPDLDERSDLKAFFVGYRMFADAEQLLDIVEEIRADVGADIDRSLFWFLHHWVAETHRTDLVPSGLYKRLLGFMERTLDSALYPLPGITRFFPEGTRLNVVFAPDRLQRSASNSTSTGTLTDDEERFNENGGEENGKENGDDDENGDENDAPLSQRFARYLKKAPDASLLPSAAETVPPPIDMSAAPLPVPLSVPTSPLPPPIAGTLMLSESESSEMSATDDDNDDDEYSLSSSASASMSSDLMTPSSSAGDLTSSSEMLTPRSEANFSSEMMSPRSDTSLSSTAVTPRAPVSRETFEATAAKVKASMSPAKNRRGSDGNGEGDDGNGVDEFGAAEQVVATPRSRSASFTPTTPRSRSMSTTPRMLSGPSASSMILSHSAEQVAVELTLLEWEVFRAIAPRQVLLHCVSSPKVRCAELLYAIERFNGLSAWVVSTIVVAPSPKEQAALLKRFVSIGRKLVELGNFNSAIMLMSALGSAPLSQLRTARAMLGKSTTAAQRDLEALGSPVSNFERYRSCAARFSAAGRCYVPYVALLLRDLTFIAEGNPNNVVAKHFDDKLRSPRDERVLRNFEKLRSFNSHLSSEWRLYAPTAKEQHAHPYQELVARRNTPLRDFFLRARAEHNDAELFILAKASEALANSGISRHASKAARQQQQQQQQQLMFASSSAAAHAPGVVAISRPRRNTDIASPRPTSSIAVANPLFGVQMPK
jgi:RasGEF domain